MYPKKSNAFLDHNIGTVADNGLPKAHGTNVMAKDGEIWQVLCVAASPSTGLAAVLKRPLIGQPRLAFSSAVPSSLIGPDNPASQSASLSPRVAGRASAWCISQLGNAVQLLTDSRSFPCLSRQTLATWGTPENFVDAGTCLTSEFYRQVGGKL